MCVVWVGDLSNNVMHRRTSFWAMITAMMLYLCRVCCRVDKKSQKVSESGSQVSQSLNSRDLVLRYTVHPSRN